MALEHSLLFLLKEGALTVEHLDALSGLVANRGKIFFRTPPDAIKVFYPQVHKEGEFLLYYSPGKRQTKKDPKLDKILRLNQVFEDLHEFGLIDKKPYDYSSRHNFHASSFSIPKEKLLEMAGAIEKVKASLPRSSKGSKLWVSPRFRLRSGSFLE